MHRQRPYYIIALYLVFVNFQKLVLSTNKALYLLKEPLVDTSQKKLFYRALFFTKAGNPESLLKRVPSQIFLQLYDHCCKLLVFCGTLQRVFLGEI